MTQSARARPTARPDLFAILVGTLLAATMCLIFVFAPTESTMGDVQRIMYLHIAVAWCGLAGTIVMGVTAAAYLVRRTLAWDHWSQAAAETGWLCTTLTLATGSLWAHEAWNTWWTWEPRLTSALVLWTLYAGYFLVRSGIEEPDQRARIGAVLAILATADIPLIVMATRWFRGVHPVSPDMDPRMRGVLLASVVSFTALFVLLTARRHKLLALNQRVEMLEQSVRVGQVFQPVNIGAELAGTLGSVPHGTD